MKYNLRRACAHVTFAVALMAMILTPGGQTWAADRQSFHYRMPPGVTNATPVGHSPGWKRLNLAIGLPLRNEAELDALLGELKDPNSPNYRHYLTPQQFTERFGPSEQDYAAVIRFAQANHLTVKAQHPNRMVLDVQGLVVDVERAFNVKLREYQHPTETRTFFAPESEPTVEAGLPVLAVSGLDNYLVPRPMSLKKLATPQAPATGSGPSGSLMGYDFRPDRGVARV
jgi:subtilase family serine protease